MGEKRNSHRAEHDHEQCRVGDAGGDAKKWYKGIGHATGPNGCESSPGLSWQWRVGARLTALNLYELAGFIRRGPVAPDLRALAQEPTTMARGLATQSKLNLAAA